MIPLKKIFGSVRVWIALIALLIAIFAINPAPDTDGVAIRVVQPNSAASVAGFVGPEPNTMPRQLEVITAINDQPITTLESYYAAIEGLEVNDTLFIETNKESYSLVATPDYEQNVIGYENITSVNELNETITEEVPIIERTVTGVAPIGLSVSEVAGSNVRLGLDLEGGTRVLIQPDEELTAQQYDVLRENLEQRLNVYGLSDIRVSVVRDTPAALGGKPQYVLIEIAGASIADVEELVSQQGRFEAIILNQTVFTGENNDIQYVGHSATDSGIGPQPCGTVEDGSWLCSYFFSVTLSNDAARRVAAATDQLTIVADGNGGQTLSGEIEFYLDGVLTNSLSISPNLKGRVQPQIQITGTGAGPTERDAVEAARADMKNLQAVIETGSLPSKITVVKADTISPLLGKEFLGNAVVVALAALISVGIMVFIRYRRFIVSLPMVITAGSEILIVLGVAALINWQMDLPAIAGLIIIIGTSVDHQIVITDELMNKSGTSNESYRRRFKAAFFIIMAAYLTTVVAMLPLLFAGAGLLKNFALTTIIGITVGVLITRPAYGKVLEILLKGK